jgi:hypothetical protein
LPGWLFLLSFTIMNHPFKVRARLTVPVVIGAVDVSWTSLISTVPSGKRPLLR